MRIVEFALDGNGDWPDLRAGQIDEGLNVFVGARETGKSTLSRFIGHVLYGRPPAAEWRRAHSSAALPEGELIVADETGRFRLRRYNDVAPPGRLTVSSLDGGTVGKDTVRELLSHAPLSTLSTLYFVDFASDHVVQQLLSEEFAHGFRSVLGDGEQRQSASAVSHRLIDHTALLNRRDELARELESRVSQLRRQSGELCERSRELKSLSHERERQQKKLQRQLQVVEGKLAEVEARLRYGQVQEIVDREQDVAAPPDLQRRLADVDQQVEKWRDTLVEMDRREADVRSQLAQLHPDDASPVLSLADQRAQLVVMRRLLSDFHGEISRLAGAADRASCVCGDFQSRLRPLADTLEKQAGLLDRSLQEQQLLLEYQDSRSEAEHLARSKNELRAQLEHLLARRQALLPGARPTRRRIARATAAGGNGRHANVRAQDELAQPELEAKRAELQRERRQLRHQLLLVERAIQELRGRCADLTQVRAGLLGDAPIERIRDELTAIQAELRRQFATVADKAAIDPVTSSTRSASGYVAQLSAGRFMQLELGRSERSAAVIDRIGQRVSLNSVSPADRDLIQLSLSLALAGGYAQHGIHLPLVLDEPFKRQDERHVVTITSVLDEFARAGHQVLVFTAHRTAADRFRWLGAKTRGICELQCTSDADVDLRRTSEHVGVVHKDAKETASHGELASICQSPDVPKIREQQAPSTRSPETRRNHGSVNRRRRRTADKNTNSSSRLQLNSPVVDAPSIGPKTAERLHGIGIVTVEDLLEAKADETAAALDSRLVKTSVVRAWQKQARLMCQIPQLQRHEARILVGCGLSRPAQIAQLDPQDLLELVNSFCQSKEGERILRTACVPKPPDVDNWIKWATQSSSLEAA